MNSGLKKDLNRSLTPVARGFSFMGKWAVRLLSLPFHGINYAIQKSLHRGNPYNGAKITRVSKRIEGQVSKVPYDVLDSINRGL